jgi:SAM-dependent methyltransferase
MVMAAPMTRVEAPAISSRAQEPVAPPWQRAALDRIPWTVRRWFDPHHYPRYEFVCEAAARVRAGEIVLDAGAGESPFRPLFAHARYVGVDNRCGNTTWDYSKLAFVSDLLQLGVRPQSVDHVLCNDVLEHVADPGALLLRLAEVLKPGGNLFLSAPQGWGEHQNPHDYFRFTSHALRMLFERAGLEVEFIRPLGGFFYYLANRIQMLPIMLFPPTPRWLAWVTAPLKLLANAVFGIAIPAIVMRLDWLDREKHTTLTYACWCRKPLPADGRAGR